MAYCLVTGTAGLPNGAVLSDGVFVATRSPRTAVGYSGRVVMPQAPEFSSDADGNVEAYLVPGSYQVLEKTTNTRFNMTVPDQLTAEFVDCVEAASIVLTPSMIQEATAARDAAQGYAEDAASILASVQAAAIGTLADGDKGDIVISSSGSVWSLDYTTVNAAVAPVWNNITGKPSAITALSGTNTGDQVITLTGDVTGSGMSSFAATIANNAVTTSKINNKAVTLAKQADVATSTIFYRKTAGTGSPEVQTLTTLKADLKTATVFDTRTAFVTWAATASPVTGDLVEAQGLLYWYKNTGTYISDLPGWAPAVIVRPGHWGVDASGATAAQDAINAAIDYVAGTGGGEVVMRGSYLLTDSIQMQSKVVLTGQHLPLLTRGGAGFDMIDMTDGNNGPIDHAVVQGFELDGGYPTYTTGDCISLRGEFNKILNNYIYDSAQRGIGLNGGVPGTYVSSGTTTTVTMNNVPPPSVTLSVGATVHLQFRGSVPDGDYVIVSVISSTVFTITTVGSYSESSNISLRVCDTRYNLIEGNEILRSDEIGIDLHTAPNNTIRSNKVQDSDGEGIAVDNESFRCVVDGNWLLGNGGIGGIGSGNSDMSRFVNNYIDQSGGPAGRSCICLGNTAGQGRNYVIANNVLVGSDTAGVRLKHDPLALPGDSGYWTSSFVLIANNVVMNSACGVLIDVDCNNNRVIGNWGNDAASRTIINNGTGNLVDQPGPGFTGAHVTYTGVATLAVTDLDVSQTILVRYNSGSGAALTFPTGANLDAAFTQISIGDALGPFSVVATGAGAATMTVNTGITIIGNAVVTGGTSSQWKLYKSAAATWTAYRMS